MELLTIYIRIDYNFTYKSLTRFSIGLFWFESGESTMIDYLDIYLHPIHFEAEELVEIIQNSLTQSGVFEFQEEESTDYARDIFSAACIVNYLENDVPVAKLAFAKASTRKGLYLANIVPKPGGSISMEKYNEIGLLFIREFKAFYIYQNKRVTITSTGEAITLADIIPGSKTRTFFQRYLNAHPLSYHPLDIERLDVFICALSRFRSSIKLELLNRYLKEELNWDKKDANWCTKRINTGLRVLEVNRKF